MSVQYFGALKWCGEMLDEAIDTLSKSSGNDIVDPIPCCHDRYIDSYVLHQSKSEMFWSSNNTGTGSIHPNGFQITRSIKKTAFIEYRTE